MIDQLVTSHRSQVSFLIALLVIATTALLFQPEFVKKIHQYSFDSYNRILHRKNDNKVVILSLDQASHQHMGVWPPPRDMWGDIIETITQMGAKAVVFDFIFMHPERAAMPEGKSMPPLADMPEGTSYYDAYFAHKIHGSKKVALPFLTARLDREQIPVRKMDIIYHGGSRGNLSRYFYANQHYIGSIPVLVNAAAGTGHANFVTESDGILRRCPIMMGRTNADNQVVDLYPALSLEVIRVAEGITTPYHVTGSPTGGIESVSFGPYTIPTDMYGRARIYYAGRQGREYISLREVIQGKVDRSHIDGKIVYIGAISENMGDVKPSPLDPVMRGVEAHAEITEQILSGKFLHRTDVMMAGEIIIMLGTTLAVIFFVQRMHTLVMVASVGLLVVLEMLAGFLAFQYKGWLFDPLCPAIITTIIFMLAAILDALRTKIVSNEKSKFLALMSHEIRTPMTGILGIIEFLKDDSLTRDERADFINTISECSKTLLNTLNDILDISKLEEGKLEISNINFDLHAVLENSSNILNRMAKNKGLSLDVQVESDVPQHIHGDPHRMQQIVMNLMNNAIKFTSKGGVTVHCAYLKEQDPAVIRVEVRDTGIGISEKNMKKLFKGFTQADDSIARKFGGTGLGLSIAKDLLHLMDGRVGVNSVLGEGSTFWFEIPYMAPIEAGDDGEEENINIGPMKILLAEDNKVNQQVAMRLLNNKGHTVSIADDGETVVRMAQEEEFDMILMDMNMPVMSGIDATQEIRDLGGTYKTLPIIALTANVVDEYVKKCYDAGMNAHVAKPFSPKELYQVMARFAPEHALNAAAQTTNNIDAEDEKLTENLREIKKQLGAEYLDNLIQNSLTESARLLKAAQDAFSDGDNDALERAAHDLKNVSGLINLEDTSHFAKVVETLCRTNELTALPDIMAILKRDGEREIRRMERERTTSH